MADDIKDIIVLYNEIKHLREEVREGFKGTNARLDKLNGSVARNVECLGDHETRVAVLERLYEEQVKPAVHLSAENRVDIAVTAAKYGALGVGAGGGVTAVVFAILKLAGVS